MTDARFQRMYQSLSAHQRAVLAIRAVRDGEREDPLVRGLMPPEQQLEFAGYLVVANALWQRLAPVSLALAQDVQATVLSFEQLRTLLAWSEQCRLLFSGIIQGTEPITASEYRTEEQRTRERWLPLNEAVELIVAERAERDSIEADEDWEELWDTVGQDLREALRSEAVTGEQQDDREHVQLGSLYDWLGRGVPVVPADADRYEVLPDDDRRLVEQGRARLRRAREVFERGPRIDLDRLRAGEPPAIQHPSHDHAARLAGDIGEAIARLEGQLIVVERVHAEILERLAMEEIAHPDHLQALRRAREQLGYLREAFSELIAPVGEPVEDEGLLEALREAVEEEEDRFRGH